MAQQNKMQSPTPDIFIVGVMKGGTTVLHEYICTHPHICEGCQKEIHYFSLFYHEGPEWYANHFKDVKSKYRTIDASPTYFDATNTALIPRLIRNYTEDPRVILITRDPIQRAVSQFVHLQKIAKAPPLVDMNIDEFFSQNLDDVFRQNTSAAYYLNQVLNFSLYQHKFNIYRQQFEPNQLLVLDNDELRSKPRKTMERVFSFLNEDYYHDSKFGEERYSNGSSISNISRENFDRLSALLYPDYKIYCQQAGIEFKQATYNAERTAA